MGKGSSYPKVGGVPFTNLPVSGRPKSGEKSSLSKGGSIQGTPSSGHNKGNPLSATYDSRPRSGDNQKGATRPGNK